MVKISISRPRLFQYTFKKSGSGFTLIELIIVIAIVGILATIIAVGINPLKRIGQARDAIRKHDLALIKGALQRYQVDFDVFPDPGVDLTADSTEGVDWIPGLRPDYLKTLPKDPKQASIISRLAALIKNKGAGGLDYLSNLFARKNRNSPEVAGVGLGQLIGLGGGGFQIDTLVSGARLFSTVECGGVRISDNGGTSWSEASKGIPTSGDIQNMWKDPLHANTIFIGKTGHILKSIDNGGNWTTVNTVTNRPFADFAAKDANTYFAVEGDRRKIYGGPAFTTGSVTTAKIWKSTDGGASWMEGAQVAVNSSDHLSSIYLHPITKNIYVSASSGGVRVSTDDGATWSDYNTGLSHLTARRLTPDSSNPNIIYLTLGAESVNPSKIYKLDVLSGNWNDVSSNLPADRDLFDITTTSTGKVYITNFNSANGLGGVWRLDGASWTQLTKYNDPLPDGNMEHGWMGEFGWAKRPSGGGLEIDPANENTIYFSTPLRDQLFKTTDGGAAWKQIYAIKNPDGSWSNRGMALVAGYGLAVDPANSNKVFIGYGDWATALSEDGGNSWRRVGNFPAASDVNKILIDPANPNNIWHVSGYRGNPVNQFGVRYSSDGGNTWAFIGGTATDINGLPGGYVRDIALDVDTPVGSRTVYVVVIGQGVYKRVGQTGNWIRVDGTGLPDTTSVNWPLRTIALDPQRDILYVGFEIKSPGTGGVYKTSDGGATWVEVTGPTGSGKPARKSITRGMAVNPNTGDLYVGAGGGAFRLQFGSSSWETLTSDGIQGLYLNSGITGDKDTVYISGANNPIGKWTQTEGFVSLSDRLPANVFTKGHGVTYDPFTDTVYAAIMCGGVYKISGVNSVSSPAPSPSSPLPTPSLGPTPSPSPALSCLDRKNVYCYVVSDDRRSFTLWATLEDTNDPQMYSQPNAECKMIPLPSTEYNYCVFNE